MNTKTFANLMSIENKAHKENVAKYAKIQAANEEAAAKKREATKRAATSIKEEDPLSINMTAKFGLVINPESVESVATKDPASSNAEMIGLLKAILDQQNNLAACITNLDTRMSNLEKCVENLETCSKEDQQNKVEVKAQNKIMRECKVLIQKVHKSICRMSGEEPDESRLDIAAMLPFTTLESAKEMEEKLNNKEYLQAMRLYLIGLKNTSGNIQKVIRHLFTDDLLFLFNWDGRCGKLALAQFSLLFGVLYDVFNFNEHKSFEKAIRKAVERSHNRVSQKKYISKVNA
ncbi:uncharacterized protein LOC129247747 [Anastrepha obliqua]|uniref:uncharacterized protein LOC129247747 n=1 Tax=Anastrepha obliqua TaxID=95512 RepID=UPI0024097FD3|nr:uncharacterized protein LOC129247747 [Anastrepha obliqua]